MLAPTCRVFLNEMRKIGIAFANAEIRRFTLTQIYCYIDSGNKIYCYIHKHTFEWNVVKDKKQFSYLRQIVCAFQENYILHQSQNNKKLIFISTGCSAIEQYFS